MTGSVIHSNMEQVYSVYGIELQTRTAITTILLIHRPIIVVCSNIKAFFCGYIFALISAFVCFRSYPLDGTVSTNFPFSRQMISRISEAIITGLSGRFSLTFLLNRRREQGKKFRKKNKHPSNKIESLCSLDNCILMNLFEEHFYSHKDSVELQVYFLYHHFTEVNPYKSRTLHRQIGLTSELLTSLWPEQHTSSINNSNNSFIKRVNMSSY